MVVDDDYGYVYEGLKWAFLYVIGRALHSPVLCVDSDVGSPRCQVWTPWQPPFWGENDDFNYDAHALVVIVEVLHVLIFGT